MKSRLEKVYSKLPNQKVNLKAHKVALSLVDDIQNELDRFEQAESEASYLAYEYGDEIIDAYDAFRMKYPIDDYIINGATRDLEEVSENIRKALSELQTKAEELGIDPNEMLNDFDDIKQRADNSSALNNDAKEKYKEVINYAGFNDFWR
jgi:DNA-binding Lrp family transcriptional regulator